MFTTANLAYKCLGQPVGASTDKTSSVEACSSVTVRLIGHHGAPMAIGAVLETVSMGNLKFYVMQRRMSKTGYQYEKMGTDPDYPFPQAFGFQAPLRLIIPRVDPKVGDLGAGHRKRGKGASLTTLLRCKLMNLID